MEQQPKRAPTAGSFKPGDPRINRSGRPRAGMALAEAIRKHIDPDEVCELVTRYMRDDEVPVEKRLAVLLPWLHAGFLKPPTASAIDVRTTVTPALPLGWSSYSLEQRRAYLDELEARRGRAAQPIIDLLPTPDDENE